MFKWLKDKVNKLFKKYKKEFVSVKQFDFLAADRFFQAHKHDLIEMAFCMGFDTSIWCPVIDNGEVVNLPIGLKDVDGVSYTLLDVPCISYVLKNGVEGKLYCYTEYDKDFKSGVCRYVNPFLFGSMLKHRFGVFKEESFKNGMAVYLNKTN